MTVQEQEFYSVINNQKTHIKFYDLYLFNQYEKYQ